MKLRTLFTLNAVVEFLFGLGFLLTPSLTLGVFGAATDPTGTMLTRVAGGLILSLGIICWMGRETDSVPAQNALIWGFLFAHLQAGIFTTLSILNGSFNALGWSAVLMDAFFVVMFFLARGNTSR
jgi:hypothetical protein